MRFRACDDDDFAHIRLPADAEVGEGAAAEKVSAEGADVGDPYKATTAVAAVALGATLIEPADDLLEGAVGVCVQKERHSPRNAAGASNSLILNGFGLVNLGRAAMKRGEYRAARVHYARSIDIVGQVLGPRHGRHPGTAARSRGHPRAAPHRWHRSDGDPRDAPRRVR